jgi:peptidoglycan/LPS O-acetylase OafA/YrhL
MSANAHLKFETLDGLRGVGALIVVVGHTLLFWIGRYPGPIAGAVMVDMFFMLSGFVIAFAYEPKIAKGNFGVARFMEARIVRLYPLFLLSLLFGMLTNLVIGYGETDAWLAPIWHFGVSAFFIPVYDPDVSPSIYPLNLPAWTLFWELIVNFIYILVWRWLSTRMLIAFVIAGAAGLLTAGIVFDTLNIGVDWTSTIGAFARAWFGFFVGVLIFRKTSEKRAAPLPRTPLVFALVALLIAIAFYGLPLKGTPARLAWEIFFICIMGPVIVYLGQRFEPPKFISPTFVWLGAISYALYLFHWPIYLIALRIPAKIGMNQGATAPYMGVAVLIVAVCVAAVAERYYDRPVRKWISLQLNKRPGRHRAEPAAKAAAE